MRQPNQVNISIWQFPSGDKLKSRQVVFSVKQNLERFVFIIILSHRNSCALSRSQRFIVHIKFDRVTFCSSHFAKSMSASHLYHDQPLHGVRVLELAGLAPVPFCGQMLVDLGADVIRVDRLASSSSTTAMNVVDSFLSEDVCSRGKRSIAVDLKSERGIRLVKQLLKKCDVLLDPFRPGTLEQLGLAPGDLINPDVNPKLVIARISGFGQDDPDRKAGHDINFLATSGLLSRFIDNSTARGHAKAAPTPPLNILGDFAGGSLFTVVGILAALRQKHGCVVDTSMTNSLQYLATFVWRHWATTTGRLPNPADIPSSSKNDLTKKPQEVLPGYDLFAGDGSRRGILEGQFAGYGIYQCSDGGHMAVGSLEPPFFASLLTALKIDPGPGDTPARLRGRIAKAFKRQTRRHWEVVFHRLDCCVSPVLTMEEAWQRQNLAATAGPPPWPKFRTESGHVTNPPPDSEDNVRRAPRPGEHTEEVLRECGVGLTEIGSLLRLGVVSGCAKAKL